MKNGDVSCYAIQYYTVSVGISHNLANGLWLVIYHSPMLLCYEEGVCDKNICKGGYKTHEDLILVFKGNNDVFSLHETLTVNWMPSLRQ